MKQILAAFLIVVIFILCNLSVRGENLPFPQDKYSILGDERNKVYEEFTSTETEGTPEGEEGIFEVPLSSETEHEYELELPTTTPQGLAGTGFLDFLESKKFFHYSREEWLKMKKQKEKGLPPGTEEVAVSSRPVSLRQTLPPGLAVELPYESQLSISGRKLIGSTMKSTVYDQPLAGKRVNSATFSMDQQMQVRIKGTVGRKVNVDVNFDDTVAGKQDISVVYKGDPDEFVQEAAFGDILMSLPSTEFVGYSKQLFGIKMDTKYKSLRTKAFFSQTKGLSEVKRFTGNNQFVRSSIADSSYIPLKYYSIKYGTNGIKAGTVKIYQADFKSNLTANIVITTNTVLESMLSPGTTVTPANFYLLVPGQDYIVDYNAGVVSFRNTVGSNYILAVDYQLSNGTYLRNYGKIPGTPKVFKDDNNTPASTSLPAGITTELKNYYNLGNVKIIRDNRRGNFILQVRDLNNNPVTTVGSYPSIVGAANNMNVDFDNGIVYFDPTNPRPFPHEVYDSGTHEYNIYTEYRYLIKILNLRPGIVPNSEKVVTNGVVLKKNEDYLIDYDAGIVTLYNTDKITEDTVTDISYDYAPFGGSGASTLIGLRTELSITRNIFIGSSFIYNFAAQTATVPDIRTTPSSLLVAEADTRLQDMKLPYVPLKLSVSGEYAMSQQNPNVMDKAIVESMDGINQTDSLSFFEENWLPAAAPNRNKFDLNAINVTRQQVFRRDISPNLENQTDEKQDIINFNYDLTKSNGGELSLVQVISKAGMDYSRKSYIEMWINGDGKGESLSFEYGQFNEDIDSTGILKTEDKNNSGTLDAGEDVGWQFQNRNGSISIYGANNGRLDTEDWLGTGILSPIDIPASAPFSPVNDSNGVHHSKVDWTGWKLFKIPVNITNQEAWRNIRQFRITIGGVGQSGTISFAEMSIMGLRWTQVNSAVGVSTVTLSAINSDDPRYVSLTSNPDYQQLYGSTNSSNDLKKKEQALSIQYQVLSATSALLGANEVFTGTPLDFSPYQYLNFFVNSYSNNAVGDTFFLQAGGDDSNYFEYAVKIPPSWVNSWRHIIIKQDGTSGRANHWVSLDPNATVTVVGNPSLNNISQIKTGVRVNSSGAKAPAEIWVDKIFVTDSFKKNGEAKKVNMDLTWPGSKNVGSTTVGGGRKEIDRNFETFSPGVYDRDYLEDNAHMGFSGLNYAGMSLFPTNARISRTRIITPSIVQQTSNLVSTLDEGVVTNYTASGDTSLKVSRYFPVLSGGYSRAVIDTQQIAQLEDRETVSGNLDYTNPLRVFVLPTGISTNYSVTNSYFKIYPSTRIVGSDNFLDIDTFKKYLQITDYHTLDVTENWGLRTPFRFGDFCNFQPSYNINTVREQNKDFSTPLNYPKSLDQNVGANAGFRFFPWLQPNLNYNIATKENYNLSYDTNTLTPTYPSTTKFLERDNSGELSWNFQVKDVLKIRYLASLGFTSSYRIQDSDSYDNVPASFNPLGASMEKLWIRGNDFNQTLLKTGTTTFLYKTYATKDDFRVSGRFNPLEAVDIRGRLDALKTLSANFTYTGTNEHTLITGTKRDVITKVWPDLLFGMNKLENMIFLDRWMSDSVLNLRQQTKTVDTLSITHDESDTYGADWRFHIFKRYDLSLGYTTTRLSEHDLATYIQTSEGESYDWSTQAGTMFGKWRCVIRYETNQNWAKNSAHVYSSQLLKNTYSGIVNADMSFPGGIPLPFTRARLNLKNRVIITGNLTYSNQTSLLNIAQNDIDNYSVAGNADYEISENFRFLVGLSGGRTIYVADPQSSFTVYQITSSLNIQF